MPSQTRSWALLRIRQERSRGGTEEREIHQDELIRHTESDAAYCVLSEIEIIRLSNCFTLTHLNILLLPLLVCAFPESHFIGFIRTVMMPFGTLGIYCVYCAIL